MLEKTVTIKAELCDGNNNLLATSVYKNVDSKLNEWERYTDDSPKLLLVPFVVSGHYYAQEEWETTWENGNPRRENVPNKVVMKVIDDIGLTYSAEDSNIEGSWEDLFKNGEQE